MPDTINPSDLIPLSQLVAEGLGASIDELAARLDDVLVDDIGQRCTTRETARKLFAQRAENEAAAQAVQARNQQKLDQLAAEVAAGIAPGVAAPEGLEHLSAVQLLSAGAKAERLDDAGRRHDEYASGASYFHPIQPEEES